MEQVKTFLYSTDHNENIIWRNLLLNCMQKRHYTLYIKMKIR